jgi:hypothetical protein
MGETVRGPWEWWAPSWNSYFESNKRGQWARDAALREARRQKRLEAARARRDAKRAELERR